MSLTRHASIRHCITFTIILSSVTNSAFVDKRSASIMRSVVVDKKTASHQLILMPLNSWVSLGAAKRAAQKEAYSVQAFGALNNWWRQPRSSAQSFMCRLVTFHTVKSGNKDATSMLFYCVDGNIWHTFVAVHTTTQVSVRGDVIAAASLRRDS